MMMMVMMDNDDDEKNNVHDHDDDDDMIRRMADESSALGVLRRKWFGPAGRVRASKIAHVSNSGVGPQAESVGCYGENG